MDAAPGAKPPNPGSALKKDEARGEDYVLKVRNNTQKYIEALIEENEGLQSLVGDLERVTLNESRIDDVASVLQEVVATGQRYVVESGDENALEKNSGLTACVPLVLDSNVIGAIAVFRLLDQKEKTLTPLDFELFDLLATHAASALYCSDRASEK